MEKYRNVGEKKLANRKSHGNHSTHPQVLAKQAHSEGEFTSRVLDEFFTEAFGEILVDYFVEWLKTDPHETKTREHLYSCAMGLGSVREKLIQKQTYGRNVPVMEEMEKYTQDDKGSTGSSD